MYINPVYSSDIYGNVVLPTVWQNSWCRSLTLCGEYKNTGLCTTRFALRALKLFVSSWLSTHSIVCTVQQLATEQWLWVVSEFGHSLGVSEDESPLHSFLTNSESKFDDIFDCLFCHQRVNERWFSMVRSDRWNIFCLFPCSPIE
jgi:hypothetical protein